MSAIIYSLSIKMACFHFCDMFIEQCNLFEKDRLKPIRTSGAH